MNEEGLGIDVVSSGEIYTAVQAGFPMEKAYFHSNNKTDADIRYAIECGVGYFVTDNTEELLAIERVAAELGCAKVRVLLRLTPGIDPHTYAAVSTGKVDSKFGSAIETGQAEAITALALSQPHIELVGFHCHVGSQMFDASVFCRSSDVMLGFIAAMKARYGYEAKQLDLGGGIGVRYTEKDPEMSVTEVIRETGVFMKKRAEELGITLPMICFEPGRSLVADTGLTLYTVGTRKEIPGYKTYVSVDGGMTDNIRYALYGASYTILPAEHMRAACDLRCSLVGRCCESGDILQENIDLPSTTQRGDVVACLTTGAYHYSMASNYNRLPRPAIVMVRGGQSYVAVRRESLADLCRLDLSCDEGADPSI
jgi:diaminopimelate decarboxylase